MKFELSIAVLDITCTPVFFNLLLSRGIFKTLLSLWRNLTFLYCSLALNFFGKRILAQKLLENVELDGINYRLKNSALDAN